MPRVFPGLCSHFVAFVIETTQEFGAAFADGPAAVVVVLNVVLRRAVEDLELFLAMIAASFFACRGDSILAHGRQGQFAGGNAVQQFVEATGIGAGRIVADHGVEACKMCQQKPRIVAPTRADELPPIIDLFFHPFDGAFCQSLDPVFPRQDQRSSPATSEERIAATQAIGRFGGEIDRAAGGAGIHVSRQPVEKARLQFGRPAARRDMGKGFGNVGHDPRLLSGMEANQVCYAGGAE